MDKQLITADRINQLISNPQLHPLVAQVLNATMLSSNWTRPMHNNEEHGVRSTHYKYRTTLRSLHQSLKLSKEISSELTITKFKLILNTIAEHEPSLITHSLNDNTKLDAYESPRNKKEVTDYYVFPLLNGHAEPNTIHDFYKLNDLQDNVCEHWQLGRKKYVGIEYNEMLTERDFFDTEHLLTVDWDNILTKNPVGRPKKKLDPFMDEVPASKQRESLKSIGERLERIEEKQDFIIERLISQPPTQ